MSTFAATSELAFPHLGAVSGSGTAVSQQPKLRERVAEIEESLERSEWLFGQKSAGLARLWALANECSESNWNGDGADPIDLRAVYAAAAFVRALPPDIPLPEFAAEPDGAVSLDWIRSRHRLLSVSVAARPRLAYAWLDGTDRGHGVARYDRQSIPNRILEGIRNVVKGGTAGIWTR